MVLWIRYVLFGVAFLMMGCLQKAAVINDDWLMDYASRPYEKKFIKEDEILGRLNGTPVIVEYVCSDVCPDYMVRIIRYDVETGTPCAKAGGREKAIRLPISIVSKLQNFCFPPVLVENWDAYIK